MNRAWAMPSPQTFSVPPIEAFVRAHLAGCAVVVDPFARESRVGTITNDLDPRWGCDYSMEAGEFCAELSRQGVKADAVLFDPPYSPRQISEVYKGCGLEVGTRETQNAALYKRVKDGLNAILKPGGVALCFGWNSAGFGKGRGYTMHDILLVAHGGAHNDTICTMERKDD